MRTRGRILCVGDSGVGKSTLVHRICYGRAPDSLDWTVGCNVEVKLCAPGLGQGPGANYSSSGVSAGGGLGMMANDVGGTGSADSFFVEFMDVGCHNNHQLSRHLYYKSVDAILLVYDVSNWKSFVNLRKWAAELVRHIPPPEHAPARSRSTYQRHISTGSVASGGWEKQISSLPVLVVGNRIDLVRKWNANKLPNVPQTLGYESVNLSATAPFGYNSEFERIDQFIRHVVDSRQDEEVAYSGSMLGSSGGSGSDMLGIV